MKRIMLQCGHYELVDDNQMINLGDRHGCEVCGEPEAAFIPARKIVEIVYVND